MEVESDERFSQAQLKGIVMITLPPPHNPSSGKTITTLTLSDRFSSAASPQESLPQHDQQPSTSSPQLSLPQLGDQPQLTTPPQNHQSLSFFFNNRGTYRIVLPILVVTLIATYLWVSLSPETLSEIKIGNDVDDDDRNYENKPQHTFLFPLHHKKRPPYRDFREVRLEGRFVGFDGAMSKEKSMSTGSMINANGVLPVVGNVYHDGLYYTYLHFGNPRRPYFLDIDTGSDLTWIQCDAHALAVER
ncbi:hypothetical protein BUALT_Bualt15G0111600 [Buddleja alternifolia]|uniref:Peptidase A1 domain-containing protein n=1 Tax=Buddleja alternifolia TaxID=168488 RepID=A0AAV6WEX6_9LAMI|nr:hypothetical protein BUALT_Bualt15G0111600 [Buddleja alternifolia]